ncbi:hypothetical protein J421_5312 (plasmid) [Gemmatirosa kalamazoonensis]|uniref:Uncharacterized protein n=1 Tax=Gemmatirosa kalamazoonensis TaxID=861299 RepID=W0RQV7_9BACT|nr:hypothetical protein [Gemmatirosa kalamazoonensis]AHG92847.1 hypothetical protein J421_5312 [Gemmatirosa kalamazoonensis]
MSDSPGSGDYRNDPMYRELTRVLGNLETASFSFCLPGFGEEDALEFFRTVPDGMPVEELPALAEEWRQRNRRVPAHPWPNGTAG